MAITLEIAGLDVQFARAGGPVGAVREVSLTVHAAECLGLVGESGAGKSQLALAAMGLLPSNARARGSVRFEGAELLGMAASRLNRLRGSRLTMVFQDPMTALTPHLRIGTQLAEVLVHHAGLTWRGAETAALHMLERVRVPEPARRLRQYPHELSGGLRQRVMIAMSLLCEPSLLIADEPTTALDMTVQAQILDVLRAVRLESNTAMILISHDLGVVAQLADRIAVMYAGRVIELADAGDLLRDARHPYTAALLGCVPRVAGRRHDRMPSLAGQPPNAARRDSGCAFAPRCPRAASRCREERPLLNTAPPAAAREDRSAHAAACHFPLSA